MNLEQVSLTGFRNLGRVEEVKFPRQGLLVVAAPNATGKTNFLEGVAVLLRGRSFRARISECVRWGEDSFLLEGNIDRTQGGVCQVAVRYHNPSHKMRIEEDGEPASVVAFYSHYPYVLFLPEDTFMLTRGPAGRRNFLNHVLVSYPHYIAALVQYHRGLRQRNAALKAASSPNDVQAWTQVLVSKAETLWQQRENLVAFMSAQLDELYSRLSGERRSFGVSLVAGAARPGAFMAELEQAFEEERRYGHTLRGPHRDDLRIVTDGRLAAVALSQGQMRSLVIALKVIAHRYMKQITKEEPLLLLDDILSELDEKRQKALLTHLPHTQTILTSTTVPSALKGRDDVYLLDLKSLTAGKLYTGGLKGGGRPMEIDKQRGAVTDTGGAGRAEAPTLEPARV